MLVAGIPKQRSKFTKFYYYSMKIAGPFLIILLSVIFSFYYIYNSFYPHYKSCADALTRKIYLIGLSILVFPSIMVVISLGYTVIGDPGTTRESIRRFKGKDNFITQYFLDSLPRCTKCGLPKPPRAHHCSTCGRCHLKMDHHCPSIGTCIALWNQQPFIVMLRWVVIEILFHFVAAAIYSCITQSLEEKIFNIMGCFILLLFALFLSSFISKIMKRVINNTTTIEELNGEYRKYDIGKEENIKQVFGSGKYRYFIPKYPTMTGFEWALDEYCRHPSNSNNTNSESHFFPNI